MLEDEEIMSVWTFGQGQTEREQLKARLEGCEKGEVRRRAGAGAAGVERISAVGGGCC